MGMKSSLELTDDLITDIIIRVPYKDFMRFTCVSKSWRSLINTDHDSFLSKLRSQRTVLLGRPFLIIKKEEYVSGRWLFNNYWIELDSIEDGNPNPRQIHNPFDHDDDNPRRDAHVIASCEGLLDLQQFYSGKMAVSNPTTKEHHVLPPNPSGDDNVEYFGFGYDRVHDCYKLVTKIKRESNDDNVPEVVIYNVNNGTWKKSRFDGRYDYDWYSQVGCVDGALYWCPDRYSLFGENEILCFLLAEEEFHAVDLPDFGRVVVFDDRLCFVLDDQRIELWLMECDYKRSSYSWRWIKFLSCPKPTFEYHIGFNFFVPICFSACRNEILFDRDDGESFWYDLRKNEFRKLESHAKEFGMAFKVSCVPSLVGIGIS